MENKYVYISVTENLMSLRIISEEPSLSCCLELNFVIFIFWGNGKRKCTKKYSFWVLLNRSLHQYLIRQTSQTLLYQCEIYLNVLSLQLSLADLNTQNALILFVFSLFNDTFSVTQTVQHRTEMVISE
jgi:hypothetical protein